MRFSLKAKRGMETIKTTEFVLMRAGITMPSNRKGRNDRTDKAEYSK